MVDSESDALTSIPDGLLSESRSSVVPESDSTQSLFDEPSSFHQSTIRPRSTTSGVWKYGHKKMFNGAVKRHGKNAIWECGDCKKELSNTGAAKQHLWYAHKVSIDEYTGEASEAAMKKKRRRVEGPGSIEAGFARSQFMSTELRSRQDNEILYNVINQQELHDRIVRLVTMRNLPHQAVEWPELKDLLLCINPMAEDKWVKSRAATPKLISDAYEFHKQKLKNLLKSSETRIHFAFDIWTSPNHKSLMAIVAHFVDKTANKLRKALVAMPEVPDHTGETMAQTFLRILDDYEISQLLGFVCTDNATSNDKALRLLAAELEKRDDLPHGWDPTLHRIRCLGHILNLAVQAFLFAEDQAAVDEAERQLNLGGSDVESEAIFTAHLQDTKKGLAKTTPALIKLHNIQVHTRASTQHYNRFLLHAGRALPADNATRWNSWYALCDCACKDYMRPAITTYVAEFKELEANQLTHNDWEVLHNICNFLLPFHTASKRLQRDDVTLDEVLWTMDVIVKHYETEKVGMSLTPAASLLTVCLGTSFKPTRFYSRNHHQLVRV